jgi:hypothetical protein
LSAFSLNAWNTLSSSKAEELLSMERACWQGIWREKKNKKLNLHTGGGTL